MSIDRKVKRNKLKNAYKNNKINRAWREYQINKLGVNNWCKQYNNSKKVSNKADKATSKTAFFI